MDLVFEHIVSREFWRTVYPANRAPNGAVAAIPEGGFASRGADVRDLAPAWALSEHLLASTGGVTRCLVTDRECRSHSSRHIAHSWSSPFPSRSLYELGSHVYVSSPEFSFLQLASKVDIRELIAYGDELCGYYAFDESQPRGFKTRLVPLTSKRGLAAYLDGAHGCRGYKQASRALQYIVDGSASPMETSIEMLNCLPFKKLGGYSLDIPRMNYEVALSPKAARIAKRGFCRADICYPDVKLDVEYHGRYDHDDATAFDSDRARSNALIEMGYTVIEITSGQVFDAAAYEAIVQGIARRLGKPVRSERLGMTHERSQLRRIIFDWNRSGGRPSFLR